MVEELKIESSEEALGYRQFVSAEPQIKSGAKGSALNPFDNLQSALEECKNQIEATGNKELQSKDVVFNFGFVYVEKQKYWIIYIDEALQNLPHYLNWGYNILTYKEIEAGPTSGSSHEAQTIWDILVQEGLVEYPQEEEIFGPTFDTPEKNSDRERREERAKRRAKRRDNHAERGIPRKSVNKKSKRTRARTRARTTVSNNAADSVSCLECTENSEKIKNIKAKIGKQNHRHIIEVLSAKIKMSADIRTEVLKKMKGMQEIINTLSL